MIVDQNSQNLQTVNQTNTTIKLGITHSNLEMRVLEHRFDQFETVASVKMTCEKKFGTKVDQMHLILQDANGNTVSSLNEDDRTLGYYSPQDGYNIFCIDLDPNSITKDLDDLSLVEKYVMSEDDYDKLPDNFRKFREKLKKANPDMFKKDEPVKKDENFMKEDAQKMETGKRCQLKQPGQPRGEIVYIGPIPEIAEGWFIGVKLDEPFGKNNGSIKGTKYFECGDNYGVFCRPDKLEQGDFPEVDDFDEDEI